MEDDPFVKVFGIGSIEEGLWCNSFQICLKLENAMTSSSSCSITAHATTRLETMAWYHEHDTQDSRSFFATSLIFYAFFVLLFL
jgi:hypothetical protein